jgi:ATP-dependent RNA helicase HelY
MLDDYGYIADGTVTEPGRVLGRIWSEADLLVAECVRAGDWDGLAPPELAAVASCVLYEARRDSDVAPALPKGAVSQAVSATLRRFESIASDERARGLHLTREPDLGFVWPMYRWARGEPLGKVLAAGDGPDGMMPAGDFVRWARQTVDLLGQIGRAAGATSGLAATAREAAEAVRHGVVADS